MFHLLRFSQLKKCSEFPSGLPFCTEKKWEHFFFYKIPKQKFSAWGQGDRMKGYPLPSQPPGPHREGKGLPTLWRTSSNCRWRVPSTWLSSGGGCGAGGTQPHTALAPEAGVTLWQCHPKPMMVFSGQPQHPEPPRAAQPRGKAMFAHCWPLPGASDMSCLACISSMAISKLTARSCPGMQGPVCHWCHWCALAGKRRAESPQQHPGHGRHCAHGASPRATRGSRGDLRTRQGGCQAPMPTMGP